MKLSILKIKGDGDADKEYVPFKILEDCNLKDFVVVDTTFSDGGEVSNRNRHFFGFPSCEVEKGDYVRLHTGTGEYDTEDIADNKKRHHFYWNLDRAVWNDEGDSATLFQIASFRTRVFEPEN